MSHTVVTLPHQSTLRFGSRMAASPPKPAPRVGEPSSVAPPVVVASTDRQVDTTGDLTAGVAAGDARAIERIYTGWFDRVFRLARSLTRRDEAFCLDVVQDVFVRVIKAGPAVRRLQSQADLDRWMVRVVHTTALDRLKADRRRIERERIHSSSNFGRLDYQEADSLLNWLSDEVARLDAEDRHLLALRFGKETAVTRAADATGISEGAAHGRLRRAIQRLRTAAKEWLP